MNHSLSEIEEVFNSSNSVEFVPIKCDNCGSKIKASNLNKHSECESYRSQVAKPFIKRDKFPTSIQIKVPKQIRMFIVGGPQQGAQNIASTLSKHFVSRLLIPQPQPDQPIQHSSVTHIGAYNYSNQESQRSEKWMKEIKDQKIQKQNVQTLSIYSKIDAPISSSTTRLPTTSRRNEYEIPSSTSTATARSRNTLQQQITYRPYKPQKEKVKQYTQSSNGFLNILSCTTRHGAEDCSSIELNPHKSKLCPCCHRDMHESYQSSASSLTANNFQIQKKKILYDRWLQARSQYKSMPTISFQQAFKRHRFLKQQQFSHKIRQYFY